MIAPRTAGGLAGPQVSVRCKVPGGPWFVKLGGLHGPEVELGPYENPAIANDDATKLRQFLALMILPPLPIPTPGVRRSATKKRDELKMAGTDHREEVKESVGSSPDDPCRRRSPSVGV
jgi:hypothetical protein